MIKRKGRGISLPNCFITKSFYAICSFIDYVKQRGIREVKYVGKKVMFVSRILVISEKNKGITSENVLFLSIK